MRSTRAILASASAMGMCVGVVVPGSLGLAGAAGSSSALTSATTVRAGSGVPGPALAYDFNGDGYADLPVGAPGEDLGRVRAAGAVNVIYGSAGGLTARGDQVWTQQSPGVPGRAERFDRFGADLASGDFDADGFADLVIESGGEDAGDGRAVWGSATVLHGSRSGLTAKGARTWPASAFPDRVDDTVGVGGMRYVIGDFNADLADDLAIGYDVQATSFPYGWLIWGGRNGLSSTVVKVAGTPLAAGDLTGDAIDDLVVTTCGWPCTTAWQVALGSRSAPLRRVIRAPSDGRYLETSDHITGDIDADGVEELLRIGTPGDGPPYSLLAQGVTGATVDGPTELTGADLGVPAEAIWHNQTAGDVTADGAAEVLIALWSAPAGAVFLVQGTPGTGILAQPGQVWSQSTPGVKGTEQPGDDFGAAVRIGRFGTSPYSSAAIGAPGEKRGTGRVTVLPGADSGLTARGDRVWSQDSAGIKGRAEPGDQFGSALG
ncbi:MAG: hypothetical protein WCF36_02565 [Candidatus Nanopelagicales bacterium]